MLSDWNAGSQKETMHQDDHISILLADDDADDRYFFMTALEEMGITWSFSLVKDGIDLMVYLHKAEKLPDVLFLDLHMPKKSGWECLKEIREVRRFDTICIAIYSNYGSEEQIDEVLNNGANIYFNKPDGMEGIKDMIAQVIRVYRYYPGLGASEEAFFFSV